MQLAPNESFAHALNETDFDEGKSINETDSEEDEGPAASPPNYEDLVHEIVAAAALQQGSEG